MSMVISRTASVVTLCSSSARMVSTRTSNSDFQTLCHADVSRTAQSNLTLRSLDDISPWLSESNTSRMCASDTVIPLPPAMSIAASYCVFRSSDVCPYGPSISMRRDVDETVASTCEDSTFGGVVFDLETILSLNRAVLELYGLRKNVKVLFAPLAVVALVVESSHPAKVKG